MQASKTGRNQLLLVKISGGDPSHSDNAANASLLRKRIDAWVMQGTHC